MHPFYVLHDVALNAAARLAEDIDDPNGVPASVLSRLLGDVLHQYARGFATAAVLHDEDHSPGPFSALRLAELSLLAERHDSVKRRYGDKRVEKRFEQQLALLMQSFGFYVVATKTGTRTVDLVCVGGVGEDRLTFLR
jgi:hypothetical protein